MDEMTIPNGLVCGNCALFKKCAAIIGVDAASTRCDFYPIKFSPSMLFVMTLIAERDTARSETEKLHDAARWVSVAERLPENDRTIFTKDETSQGSYNKYGCGWCSNPIIKNAPEAQDGEYFWTFTHWRYAE